jgi:hypothetical protein
MQSEITLNKGENLVGIKDRRIALTLFNSDTGEELCVLKFDPENMMLWEYMHRVRNIDPGAEVRDGDSDIIKKAKENKHAAAFAELRRCIDGIFGEGALDRLSCCGALNQEAFEGINAQMKKLFDEYQNEKKELEKEAKVAVMAGAESEIAEVMGGE